MLVRLKNCLHRIRKNRTSPLKPPSGSKGRRTSSRRYALLTLEELERRLAPSVGGGWVSSTQDGQSGDGFFGQYYNNATLTGTPAFTRWDDRVDFLWPDSNAYPGGSPDPAFQAVGPNMWSAKWTGTLVANFSETYTFQINSAGNGVRLWVTPVGQQQSNPLINDWTPHGGTTDRATMTLQAGQDYNVELDVSQTNASSQQIQLQWSSPSTPLEDIEPVTPVGLNVDGGDSLFANMVNGGTRDYWWVPGNTSQTVPTDSNLWPTADAEILLGEGGTITSLGGSYLVQFTGMATVSDWGQNVDWWVNGTNLNSSILQAGEGYNPSTNTTTATMVVSPSSGSPGFYLSFTNTSRDPNSPLDITAISETGGTVTVSVPSVADIAANQLVTIAGFTGSAVNYDGTFAITSVNTANNTFTYKDTHSGLPANPSGGTALVNPQNGITNLYVMQPSTEGGSTPLPVGTLFTPSALNMLAQYTTLRFMDLNATNGNLTSDWSDRTLVSDNFWSSFRFNSGSGVDTGVDTASNPLAGVPWEVQIALANETGKDIYINIPSNVSLSYLANLADLFAYGSDGVTPYTSPQANPVWKPLNPNLKVYIEFSNETWNSGFVQAETRSDGWANQLSQRALYDYLTNNQNDPLYPGGGSNAYNDGAILASYYNVNSSNDSAFLSTYNPNPAPSTDGGSPAYFSNTASINGYLIGQGWVGLRDVQISNIFKTAFGETTINAADTDSRVRPVFEWQYGGSWAGALGFINGEYGSQHPVNYYLYGGGGGWYASNSASGFDDVEFTNPDFADGLTGWSANGSAGIVTNVSQSAATSETLGTLRNNYSGWVGYEFTTGNNPLIVYELGRWVVAGNTGNHTVKLVDAATGLNVPGASVSIQTNYESTPGQFEYDDLATPVTLAANHSYYLLSSESSGGDQWYDQNTVVNTTSDLTITNAVYSPDSKNFILGSAGNYAFGPVDLKYSLSPAPLGNPDAPVDHAPNVTGSDPNAVYLQPGASISQNVTFSGGYADITLFAMQTVAWDGRHGLTITLTPTNGGPAINNGQPLGASEAPGYGPVGYSDSQNAYLWSRTAAFYTGNQPYTYTITFTSTLTSGTIFLDNLGIQTVNGMFNDTAANGAPSISMDIESDVNLALQYGLHDVGYEGGYLFSQNLSGYLDENGYRDMGSSGYSSSVPNVGMYANLDPRTEQLAIDTLDQFYAAGGTLPIVFESTGNPNSWAVAAPNYFNFNTPKQQAAASVEQAPQPATYGLTPGQAGTSGAWWLSVDGEFDSTLDSTYLTPLGTYALNMTFGANSGAPVGQIDPIEVLIDGRLITTVNVPTETGGTFSVLVGQLAAGQYSVKLINTAPTGNASLALGRPGTPIFTLYGIADAGFVKPDVSGTNPDGHTGYWYDPPTTLTQPQQPWTFAGDAGIEHDGSALGAANAPDGDGQAAFLQDTGSISQAIYLPAGTYTVSFMAAQRAGYSINPIQFSVDGQNVGGPISPTSTSWNRYTTVSFTITTAGLHTIAFTGTGNTTNFFGFLDAVSISEPAPGVEVNLSSTYNQTGIYEDGSTFGNTGGFAGDGFAISSNVLGNGLTWNGQSFNFGPVGADDVISAAGQTIALPQMKAGTLYFLGAAVYGNQTNQTFTVTYTDGTTQTFSQSMSDWYYGLQGFAGESVAVAMPYATLYNGNKFIHSSFSLYGYSFDLDPTKTVKSITLPNNSHVKIVAMTLSTSVPVNLSSSYNNDGIVNDGSTFSTGLDNDGNALSANWLGSTVMWNNQAYVLGAAGGNNVVQASGQTIALPQGNYSTLSLLAVGVNGNQPNLTFTVTYTDGTTQTFTQSISDWASPQNYPGESIAATMPYLDTSSGGKNQATFYVYGYIFALNSSKTVESITLPNNSNVDLLAIDLS
jgi:hypothetical protein